MDWMGVLDKALGWAIPAICAGVVSWSVARVRAMNKERAADRERDADVRQGHYQRALALYEQGRVPGLCQRKCQRDV